MDSTKSWVIAAVVIAFWIIPAIPLSLIFFNRATNKNQRLNRHFCLTSTVCFIHALFWPVILVGLFLVTPASLCSCAFFTWSMSWCEDRDTHRSSVWAAIKTSCQRTKPSTEGVATSNRADIESQIAINHRSKVQPGHVCTTDRHDTNTGNNNVSDPDLDIRMNDNIEGIQYVHQSCQTEVSPPSYRVIQECSTADSANFQVVNPPPPVYAATAA